MGHATASPNSPLKRLVQPFVSPPTVDFWLRQLGSIQAWSRCYARVIERRDESANTITLRLLPNANFGGFESGQHVNVTATIGGRRVTRSYSFSSKSHGHAPAERWVEITVRHDPEGLMSSWLFEHAKRGVVVELEQVFGDMTARSFCGPSLVFLAGGSGITPLMSLLREQASSGMPHTLTLVYWDQQERNFCFVEELEAMSRRFDNFSLHAIATKGVSDRRISEAQLEGLGVDVRGAQIFACGGGAFVEQARSCTEHMASGFHAEAFTPIPRPVTNDVAQTFTVELTASKRQLEVSNQDTLLAALEQQGVVVETGCRMGVCNTCSCEKIAGHTLTPDSDETDANTNASIRLCVTRPASDLQLAI